MHQCMGAVGRWARPPRVLTLKIVPKVDIASDADAGRGSLAGCAQGHCRVPNNTGVCEITPFTEHIILIAKTITNQDKPHRLTTNMFRSLNKPHWQTSITHAYTTWNDLYLLCFVWNLLSPLLSSPLFRSPESRNNGRPLLAEGIPASLSLSLSLIVFLSLSLYLSLSLSLSPSLCLYIYIYIYIYIHCI